MSRTDPRPHYGTKRRVRHDGYVDVWMPDHPLARRDGYASEHRVVAWDAGLLTDPGQVVHHLNGDKADNRIENLSPLATGEHTLHHVEARGTIRSQYGEWTVKPRTQRES